MGLRHAQKRGVGRMKRFLIAWAIDTAVFLIAALAGHEIYGWVGAAVGLVIAVFYGVWSLWDGMTR